MYIDNYTITVFVTNVLFMSLNLVDVNTVTNTHEHIFLSKERVQFNEIDPTKIVSAIEVDDHSDQWTKT